jgi:uncharacterized repeat protein (TIGR01451 family)
MKKFVSQLAVLAVLLIPVAAHAKPLITISMATEKEVTVVKNGQKVTTKVAATRITQGDVMFYTMTYTNSGDEAATSVVLNDPIPPGTVYLPGSAFGAGADITFSIDGGKTYAKPALLVYEVKRPDGSMEKRTASPEEYTDIHWEVKVIKPGETGKVGFEVIVK